MNSYFKVLLRFSYTNVQLWVRHIPAPDWQSAVEKAIRKYPLGFAQKIEFDTPEGEDDGTPRA